VSDIAEIARALVAPGKGILAADESTSTIKRRFDAIGVENSEDNRRAYRELLFRTPGIAQYVSGVILYDETIRQKAADGTPLVKILKDQGIHPGIKVDLGAKPLPFCPGEVVTEGLDGLRERLAEYKGLGAVFSKWRAVITIGDEIPSDTCTRVNAHALARYAALSQEAGIVPIVEPEVLMDGDHGIERCEEVTDAALERVFDALFLHRVRLEGMVLKPNMVIAGKKSAKQARAEQVAEATVRCLLRRVPAAVPGIAFLSGGQSEAEATLHLSLMNRGRKLPFRAPGRLEHQQHGERRYGDVRSAQRMRRREAVHDVVVLEKHVADAAEGQNRKAKVRPGDAPWLRPVAPGPQQERKDQAEAERQEQQRVLIRGVSRQPRIDVVDGHGNRDHADNEAGIPCKLAHCGRLATSAAPPRGRTLPRPGGTACRSSAPCPWR